MSESAFGDEDRHEDRHEGDRARLIGGAAGMDSFVNQNLGVGAPPPAYSDPRV